MLAHGGFHDEPAVGPGARLRPRSELLDDVKRLEGLLPPGMFGISEVELRRRSSDLVRARTVIASRRDVLGSRPSFDPSTEGAVLEAREAAADADKSVRRSMDGCHRLLATGNAAGVAIIGLTTVAVMRGVNPISAPVVTAMLAAAGGPVGAVVAGWKSVAAARAARCARLDAWTTALERVGVTTMGDLAATRIRFEHWRRSHRELDAAIEAETIVRQHWEDLVGEGVDPVAVNALAAALRQLRLARLGLLGHALNEFTEQQTELRTDMPTVEPEVDLRAVPPLAELVEQPESASRVLDVLERIKAKGVQLWVST
ncbi:MAG: hypothetical protein ACR2H3_01640 [Acidimicrobiales bacterium]